MVEKNEIDETEISQLALRQELHELVVADLMGPQEPEEELPSGVRRRYVLGRLAPRRKPQSDEIEPAQEVMELQVEKDTAQEGKAEEPLVSEDSLLPSSMGLSFAVDIAVTQIRVTAEFGVYEPVTVVGESGHDKKVWKRSPVQNSNVYTLAEGNLPLWAPTDDKPEVYVRGRCRRRESHWSITLFLINNQKEPKQQKDLAWVFQPQLSVTAADSAPIFVQRTPPQSFDKLQPEDLAMRMLYRNTVEFATGHGVSVHAEVAPDLPHRASRLTTKVIPTYEVERMDPPLAADVPGLDRAVFDMKRLSEVEQGGFVAALGPLVESYAQWIGAQNGRLRPAAPDLQPYLSAATTNLSAAERARERILAGIELLDQNADAADAFRFANKAMYRQRIRSIYTKLVRRGQKIDVNDLDEEKNRSWRPFQLAFVLLNIPALVDPTHDERQGLADLLWFPTGGGKTEAYLGVAAFAMGIRRLQRDRYELGYEGITVLMRYTLRLLTLQQFQRAATLIAACEVIRRSDPLMWGDEPFRIGLWVGQRSTPNRTEEASAAISDKRNQSYSGSVGGSGTPYQLTSCPWCGNKLEATENIEVETFANGRGRTFQHCSNWLDDCPFSRQVSPTEGIPIVVVDEEIYRRLPSLLIATVDKFAQMPWKGETQMLFGRVSGYCERHGYISPNMEEQCYSHRPLRKKRLPATKRQDTLWLRPPDLIIQDELHLINGPLGTMVGLYETAVDHLATWQPAEGKMAKPKVIASTATIRQASKQVNSVFARRVNVFPPPGLDATDNFFSRRAPSTEKSPGRLYVGIMAPGRSRLETLIPVYTAYMAAAQKLYEKYGAAADPWMTAVGYFNSLRELGSMRRAVEDSVQTRLRNYDKGAGNRWINVTNVEELTSRKSAEDIPKILDRLDLTHNPALQTDDGKYPVGQYPLDVVLATNMISVGVDVDRLGLMIAAGQPKATAEYIQATSRVGRKFPGLVATVYAWSRPRDLSHYEGFDHYHATFYQQVEALSVTPFASRAVDRGLFGVLTALIRLGDERFNENGAANEIDLQNRLVKEAQAVLQARATQASETVSGGDRVGRLTQKKLDRWAEEARDRGAKIGYKNDSKEKVRGLLSQPNPKEAWHDFTTLNSLRDVEAMVGLVLRDQDSRQAGANKQEENANEL